MSDVQNRQYQADLERQTYEGWNAGHKAVLNVLATGGGKSIIMSNIALRGYHEQWIQAIIAHRNELVSQMSAHVGRRGIPHRIIGSDATIRLIQRNHRTLFHGHQFVHPTARTSVVGVDTLIARKDELKDWAYRHTHWEMDEAHHTIRTNKWGKAVEMMPNAVGSGYTATPSRADGQGLGRHADGVFDIMNIGPSMRWLIDKSFLCDYELACPRSDLQVKDSDVSENGDWSNQTLRKAAKESHIVGDVVENYCKYAFMRQAIVFATDVETANEIAEKFKTYGIAAASVSAKTPTDAREKYINEFKSGKIKVLINVDLFDEGFDVPACDVVIMARPTASLGKFLQMCGRALRYVPGKVALIIDMVSNIVRHGYPDKPREWTLDRREKRAKQIKDPDEIPLTECRNAPICVKPYPKFMPACPFCGKEKPLPEPRQRTLEMVEGDLILLDREALARMRAATILPSAYEVGQKAGYAGGPVAAASASKQQEMKIAAYEELKETMAQWAGIERARGFSDREIQKRFYFAAGMDVLSALDVTRPRSEMESTTATIRSWWNKRTNWMENVE